MGTSEEVFTAHYKTLSGSKVLTVQCSDDFHEGHSKVIRLKESDPKIFACVLEYLYRGDYWPKKGDEFANARSEDKDVRATQMRREADIYCMADYYDLLDLQELVVEKIQMLTPLAVDSFLDISEYIYDQGGPEGPFRAYFREQMGLLQKEAIRPWIDAREVEIVKDLFFPNPATGVSNNEVLVNWPSGRKVKSKDDALRTAKELLRDKIRSKKGKSPRNWFGEPLEVVDISVERDI